VSRTGGRGNLDATLARFNAEDERALLEAEEKRKRDQLDTALAKLDPDLQALAPLGVGAAVGEQIRRSRPEQEPDLPSDPAAVRTLEHLVNELGLSQDVALPMVFPGGGGVGDFGGAVRSKGTGELIEDPEITGEISARRSAVEDAYDRGVEGQELDLAGRRVSVQESAENRQVNAAEREASFQKTKAGMSILTMRDQAQNVKEKVAQAIDQSKWSNTGPVFGRFGMTSDQTDLDALLTTVGANEFVRNLQEMRQNSPTGGSVGNVTEKEGEKMQSLVANLRRAQSEQQLDKGLQDIADLYEGSLARIEAAYLQDYEDGFYGSPKDTKVPEGVDPLDWEFMTDEEKALFSQ